MEALHGSEPFSFPSSPSSWGANRPVASWDATLPKSLPKRCGRTDLSEASIKSNQENQVKEGDNVHHLTLNDMSAVT